MMIWACELLVSCSGMCGHPNYNAICHSSMLVYVVD